MSEDSRDTRMHTQSGIEVDPLYGGGARDLGLPGEFPFTRGVYPDMYRGRLWTMRQYAGFGTAHETNLRYHYLLEQGTTGLSVAFDLPTQMGYDSDHAMAEGEVGRVGVAVDSIEDMRVLFEGISLDQVSTSMTINSTAAVLLALYVAVGDERGIARGDLSGTVQNDVLRVEGRRIECAPGKLDGFGEYRHSFVDSDDGQVHQDSDAGQPQALLVPVEPDDRKQGNE